MVKPDLDQRSACLAVRDSANTVIYWLGTRAGERPMGFGKLVGDHLVAVEVALGEEWPWPPRNRGQVLTQAEHQLPIYRAALEQLPKPPDPMAVREVLRSLVRNSQTKSRATIESALTFFRALAGEALKQSKNGAGSPA